MFLLSTKFVFEKIHSLGCLVDFDMVGLWLIFRGFFNNVESFFTGHFTSLYPNLSRQCQLSFINHCIIYIKIDKMRNM